jgi:hypothetical protein
MKSHSLFRSRFVFAALCGSAIAAGVFAPPARADAWDKKTLLTVNEPIQVTKTVLQPGQYVFKLLNSQSDRHIVQIFNERQDHVYATVLAIPNYRLQPTDHSRFTFWETPPGRVKALRAWFYPGDNFGQEFEYPKELAMATNTSTATVSTESMTATRPVETPQPQPEVQSQVQAPAPEPQPQQPVQVAENTQPPAPAAPEPQPASAPPPTLPKTASPYPLIGLSGVFLLGLRSLLRRRQRV